ncbi:unnamed protein product [Arabidopsis halleri]
MDPFAVLLICDVENATMESDKVPDMLANVTASLKTVNPEYHIVEKVMVGNMDLGFIKENRLCLRRENFILMRVPKRERICHCGNVVLKSPNKRKPHERAFDVADRCILRVILDRVLTKSLPPNILLTSSDCDFTKPLEILRSHEYTLMLACDIRASIDLKNQVMYVWNWNWMYKEERSPAITNHFNLRWQARLKQPRD